MRFLKENGFALYLGLILSVLGVTDWRFWVIFVPTIALVVWERVY